MGGFEGGKTDHSILFENFQKHCIYAFSNTCAIYVHIYFVTINEQSQEFEGEQGVGRFRGGNGKRKCWNDKKLQNDFQKLK